MELFKRRGPAGLWVLWLLTCLFATSLPIAGRSDERKDDRTFWRRWEAVEIPGAFCGNGEPFSVYLSTRNVELSKIAVVMMGGGACWSEETCYGSDRSTLLFPIPGVVQKRGFLSLDPQRSPVFDHAALFVPYCTGDVHVGRHIGQYGSKTVRHQGRTNVELALAHLSRLGRLDFRNAQQIVLTGFSAGALGALMHSLEVDRYTRSGQKRVLVVDAPGLHFGPKFWDKFSPALVHDFQEAMKEAGIDPERQSNPGLLAGIIPALCRKLPGWTVGVLQGSRDRIMSSKFGDLTPEEHEKLVFGAGGVLALTADPSDSCSSWVASTDQHTFLVDDLTARTKAGGLSAMDYVRELLSGGAGRNYRD
jgi:hypothetical protein